jgi:hypothetical protein
MVSVLAMLGIASGCVSAQFHSKTGRTYAPITPRAVIVLGNEAGSVRGEVIGTITAKGDSNKDQRDLADEAARVAAENGGTHVLVTQEWAERNHYHHPATSSTDCTGDVDAVSCQTTYEPATSTTGRPMPRAEFVVIRVAAELWGRLPPQLRPTAFPPVAPPTPSRSLSASRER